MAPTRPPVSGGRWKAIGLAVAVHLLLAAFLIVGIRWKTSAPPPLQAELFTPPANPVPKPLPPEPVPPPAPKPPPPAPKPEVATPDIVTEKTRLAAAEAERQRFAEARKETERRLQEKKRAEDEARKKAEDEARRKAEELKAQKAREAQEARKKAAELAKKEAEEKARKAAEEKAARAAEEQRTAYLKGLMDKASGGSPSGTASVPGTTGGGGGGTDNSYRSLLSARIRAGTVFSVPAELSGNPKAVFVVTVMPDCTISSVKLRKSSGLASWDEAAERGIQRASPLPRMRDGTCPPELEITRGPRDSD